MLALPIELLQRVTDNLSDETLTTFRLTCKAIEATTFDTFAKIYFEERYCCIYEKPRWTLLREIIFSSIGDRVRRVIFTTHALAPAQPEHLQLAPKKPAEDETYDILNAQCDVVVVLEGAVGVQIQTAVLPSKDMIENCLICIRNLSPDIRLKVEFDEEYL